MADKMMRTAGRTSDGIAKAFLVNADGGMIVDRPWVETDTQVFNLEITDTNWHTNISDGTVLDISAYPLNSLRMRNTTGKVVTVRLLNDLNRSNTTYLAYNGEFVDLVLPATSDYYVFTPQECPWLNYLHYLKFQVKAAETPASGSVVITHCGRK